MMDSTLKRGISLAEINKVKYTDLSIRLTAMNHELEFYARESHIAVYVIPCDAWFDLMPEDIEDKTDEEIIHFCLT